MGFFAWVLVASAGSEGLGDAGESDFCGAAGLLGCSRGVDDFDAFEDAFDLFDGLLPFAIPLLHTVGAPASVGSARGTEEEAAHLETAAGRARRRAALESIIAMSPPAQDKKRTGEGHEMEVNVSLVLNYRAKDVIIACLGGSGWLEANGWRV